MERWSSEIKRLRTFEFRHKNEIRYENRIIWLKYS